MIQDDFQVCIENFKKFVNKVFSGGNPNQKAILLKECQNVVKIAQESKKSNMEALEFFPDEEMIKTELPNEIWLKIIGFLETKDVFGNFAFVCKHFKTLILQPTAIKRFSFDLKKIYKNHWFILIRLLNTYKTITELTMVEACIPDAIICITEVMKSNPKLKSLRILNHLNCQCINQVNKLIQCIKEHRIDLENLELNFVGSDATKDICTFKNLKSLKISLRRDSPGDQEMDFLYNLANNCEYLKEISFFNMKCFLPSLKHIKAFDYFLGKRSQTLKSIDTDMALRIFSMI